MNGTRSTKCGFVRLMLHSTSQQYPLLFAKGTFGRNQALHGATQSAAGAMGCHRKSVVHAVREAYIRASNAAAGVKSPWMQHEILMRFQAAAASEETLNAFWEDFSLAASSADPHIMRERRKEARIEKERERLQRERVEREGKTEHSRSPPRATGSTIAEELP